MELSYDDVLEILKIIDASSCEELHLELGDFKLIVKKRGAGPALEGGAIARVEMGREASAAEVSGAGWPEGGGDPVVVGAQPAAAGSVSEPGPPKVQAGAPTVPERRRRAPRPGGVELKAPMVGTFYRAPAPGAPPFVEAGSLVKEDDTVCIIEVMKLMNSIKAGCRGRVVEICAENAALVEFGQTLMVIEPVL